MSLIHATRPAPAGLRNDFRDLRNERRDARNERRHARNERRRVRPEDTAHTASRLALTAQYVDAVAAVRKSGPEVVAAQYFDAIAAVRMTRSDAIEAQSAAPVREEVRTPSRLQTTVPLPLTAAVIAATFAAAVLAGLGLGG